MRLIDADKMVEKLEKWDWQDVYLPSHFKEMLIDEAPTVEPEKKSAEEMFRDIGYERFGVFDGVTEYRKRRYGEIIRIDITPDGMCRCAVGTDALPFARAEILACARFIEEKEADHGTE